MLRILGCPAYYHVKEDKLNSRAKKVVFLGFKRGVKGYKPWDRKDGKTIVSSDVTFDEASMMKPTSSQQVKSEQTKEVLQWVESDVTPHTLDRSVSIEFSPKDKIMS